VFLSGAEPMVCDPQHSHCSRGHVSHRLRETEGGDSIAHNRNSDCHRVAALSGCGNDGPDRPWSKSSPKVVGHNHYMKSQAPPRGTPYWVMYFASCGIGFLGGVLSLAAGASVAGRPGYPWWPIVLLAVLWAVMLLVAVAVGVIRFRGERRTAGAPPRV
jgi:hypothetical protein